jgi:hypothetical protein
MPSFKRWFDDSKSLLLGGCRKGIKALAAWPLKNDVLRGLILDQKNIQGEIQEKQNYLW